MPSIIKSVKDAFAPIFRPAGTIIEGIDSGSWASPVNPIRPTRQLGVGVRQWDFTPGINLQFTPRGDVPVKFGHLWTVSNSFDLCRLFIETRKDQIVNRAWSVRVKAKPGEPKKQRLEREANNPNVASITALLKCPDGVHSFDLWLRMWLEQLLVFDAPCIYPTRNMLGDVFQLRIISGATITPLLDEQGFTPLPPNPAYQQIILGIPTSNMTASPGAANSKGRVQEYTADELIYSPRNPRVDSRWGFPPVEQIITTLAIAANRQQFFKDFYTSGNVPEGLLPMPADWTIGEIKEFQRWFDLLLAGNLAKKRRLIAIPDTKNPAQFSKEKALVDTADDYLTRVVAYAFSVSPQNLIKQVNRGTAKESSDTAQIEGLEPYLKHVENVLNHIISRVLTCDDVEFAYQDEREMDPLKQAQVDNIYVGKVLTVNETRVALGFDERPEPEADMLGEYTPTGFVPLGESTTPAEPEDDEDEPTQKPSSQQPKRAKVRKGTKIKLLGHVLTPNSRRYRQEASTKLGRFLKDQAMRISKQAATEYVKIEKADASDRRHAEEILALLGWDYLTLHSIMQPYLEGAAEEGVNAGAYQMAANAGASLTATTSGAMEKAKAAANARAAELVGMKVADDGTIAEATGAHWAMSTTAKDDVLNTIKQAIKEDWTPSQLEAVIQASALFTQDHADMIAEAEIGNQQALGHLASWKAAGVVEQYQWMVADLGCCAVCEGFSLVGPVDVGHEFAPGVTVPPQAHPGTCRCWLLATKMKDEVEA